MTTATGSAARQESSPRWERPVRLTPLYHEHLAHGASMIERDGWLLPHSYGELSRETATLHDAVGLLDWSELSKINLKGDEIEGILRAVFPVLENPGVARTITGSDGTQAYRLTEEEALVLSSPAQSQQTLQTLSVAAQYPSVCLVDLTSALACLRLLGPKAPVVLERASALDLAPDRFAHGTVLQGAVARVHALVARRDTAGLIGYDLYVDRDLGAYLWNTLLEIGAPLGILPVGRDAEVGLS